MRVGADGHAAAAIGADGIPVVKALLRVDLPALCFPERLRITDWDRSRWAIICAFLADGAEVENGGVVSWIVGNQG